MDGIINRRGQKVVCIDDNWTPRINTFVSAMGLSCPVAGKTYIVDNFLRCPNPSCGREHYITLMSHPDPNGGQLGFEITAFVPVDFRKTNISDLVELVAKQSAKPDVKAPLEIVDRFAASFARAIAGFSIATFIIEKLGLAMKKPVLRLPDVGDLMRELEDARRGSGGSL